MNHFRRLCITLLPITLICLLLIQFVLSNELAGSSQRMRQVDKEIEFIERENFLLEQQAAVGKSIATIAKKALEFGLSKQAEYVTISLSEPVALRAQ